MILQLHIGGVVSEQHFKKIHVSQCILNCTRTELAHEWIFSILDMSFSNLTWKESQLTIYA
jgi:hypothetical protein